jgi:hypothetical protein
VLFIAANVLFTSRKTILLYGLLPQDLQPSNFGFSVVLIYLKFGFFFHFGTSKGENKKGLFTSPLQ